MKKYRRLRRRNGKFEEVAAGKDAPSIDAERDFVIQGEHHRRKEERLYVWSQLKRTTNAEKKASSSSNLRLL